MVLAGRCSQDNSFNEIDIALSIAPTSKDHCKFIAELKIKVEN